MHFLNMWFSGIIAITNSNDDSASSRKIPLRIFISAQLFPLAESCQPVFHGDIDKLYDFVRYLVHFETVYNPACGTILYSFLRLIHAIDTFFCLVLHSLRIYWSMYSRSSVPHFPLRFLFSSSGTIAMYTCIIFVL